MESCRRDQMLLKDPDFTKKYILSILPKLLNSKGAHNVLLALM